MLTFKQNYESAIPVYLRTRSNGDGALSYGEERLNQVFDQLYFAVLKRGIAMAKKNPAFEKFWFASLKMPKAAKSEFETWKQENEDDFWHYLSQAMNSGYKLSARYDYDNSTHIVSLTCLSSEDVNFNGVMVTRASEIDEAMWLSLYKHWILCDEQEWPSEQDEKDWG